MSTITHESPERSEATATPDDALQTDRAAPARKPPQAPSALVRDLLVAMLWFGLVTGLIESGYWAFRKFVLGELIFFSPAVFWLAPSASVMLFAVPGLLLVVMARSTRRPVLLPFGVTLFGVLLWLNVLFLAEGLHPLAQGMLACGLAAATGFLFDRRPEKWMRLMRRSAGWLAAGVLLIAVLQQTSARTNDAAPPAAGSGPESSPQSTLTGEAAPNVLLIVLDTVRADALGLYGARENTSPHIDRWAEQGVVFEQATSTAPWTLPSTAGMFTGRLPFELSADWMSPLDERHPTLAERLSENGYATAGFVSNTRYCSAETGLARGFEHYEDYRLSWSSMVACSAIGRRCYSSLWMPWFGLDDAPRRKSAEEINASVLSWLPARGERPFFVFLNYLDAHDPYIAPPPYDEHRPETRFRKMMIRYWWSMRKEGLSPADIDFARAAYDDCVRYLDARIGRLLAELQDREILENTVVIITSDHGEHFGEHGLLLHGNSLYEPLLHVPLIVIDGRRTSDPSAEPGSFAGRVSDPVSLQDLPATVLDLAGLSGDSGIPGTSLARHWRNPESEAGEKPSPVLAEIATQATFPPCHGRSPVTRGAMVSVRLGRFKYIRNGDGVEELYDLRRDPDEKQNIAETRPRHPALLRLRTLIPDSAPAADASL